MPPANAVSEMPSLAVDGSRLGAAERAHGGPDAGAAKGAGSGSNSVSALGRTELSRWRGVADAIGAAASKLYAAYEAAQARHPLAINLACLARASPPAPRGAREGSPAPREALARAARLVRFADAAYGLVLMSALGTYAGGAPPASALRAGAEAAERWCVASHLGIDEADVRESQLVGGSLELPRHYVAVDHAARSIVVAVRGTSTVEDAATDLVCEAAELRGVGWPAPLPQRLPWPAAGRPPRAHEGMARHAAALDGALAPLLAELRKETGYGVVLTGHSMGAGVAVILALRMATRGEPPAACVAFACPPVVTDVPWATKAMAGVEAYIVADDIVPHLSIASVEGLLTRLARIDSCEAGARTRLAVAAGIEDAPPDMRAAAAAHDVPSGAHAVLEGPAASMVHLPRAEGAVDAAQRPPQPQRQGGGGDLPLARRVDPAAFTARIDVSSVSMTDHLQSSYVRALAQAAERAGGVA